MPSGHGAFEVIVNGKTLHSKLKTGDFPDFDAILKAVKSMS
jgi:selT/selW/selH-like putative selenoprotein